MRHILGEDRTRDWLVAVKANEAKSYPKNSAIIQAIAAGEVDLGLPNHYYLLQFKRDDPDFPVEQTAFEAGDPGNLVNIAGVGVLATSTHPGAGALVMFLLSDEAQDYVAAEILEYPVAGSGGMGAQLADSLGHLRPTIDLNDLKDLEGTLTLLRSVELL